MFCVQVPPRVRVLRDHQAVHPQPAGTVQYSTVQYCAVQCSTSPNLQDDSDANNNDSAGRMLKMEKACEKVNIVLTSTADITLQIHQSRG